MRFDVLHAEIRLAQAYSRLYWKMKQVPNCQKINPWQPSRAIFAVATWYPSQLGTKGLVIYVFLAAAPWQGNAASYPGLLGSQKLYPSLN